MSKEHKKPERIYFDTDPGIDDAMALFLALASPELQIDGVGIVMGNNNDIDILAKNACLILQMAGRKDIPVILGASKPLTHEFIGHTGIKVHHENGIGGVQFPVSNLDLSPLEKYKNITAAQFLVNHVLANPFEITIVAIGPLTNIALAVAIGGDKFIKAVKRVVIMGGSVAGIGNKTPAAEANICNDPNSGKIVFDAFPDIHMAGLNVTHQLELTPVFREQMRKLNGVGQFLFDVTTHYVNLLDKWKSGSFIHDPTAIMYMIRPDIFETRQACIDVEDKGRLTSGQTVADWVGTYWNRPFQTTVLMKVDQQQFYAEYLKRIATFTWKPESKAQLLAAEQQIENSQTIVEENQPNV